MYRRRRIVWRMIDQGVGDRNLVVRDAWGAMGLLYMMSRLCKSEPLIALPVNANHKPSGIAKKKHFIQTKKSVAEIRDAREPSTLKENKDLLLLDTCL
jgi:hypothetical protein